MDAAVHDREVAYADVSTASPVFRPNQVRCPGQVGPVAWVIEFRIVLRPDGIVLKWGTPARASLVVPRARAVS